MKSIKRVADELVLSTYTGSEATYNVVAGEIEKRWGRDEVKNYNPYTNALTFAKWISLGYCVKKGEKAIRSVTFIEKKDEDGNVIKRFKHVVCIFYYKQVGKIKI